MNAPSDGQLIRQVLAGARARYSLLMQRHQGRLYRYALGMVSEAPVARQLVEQAFVDAYGSLREVGPEGRLDLWALRLLRRRCLNHLENPRPGPVPPNDGAAERNVHADAGEARSGVAPDRSSPLQEALHALPQPEEREAFLLKHVEQLSYEEMMEVLDATEDEVRARVYRARERMAIATH